MIWGSRAAIDVFRTQALDGVRGGELAIIASLSAHGPVPGLSVYAATKAAVLSLATSLDSELRRDVAAVHAICPDGVNTLLLTGMADDSQGKALVRSGATCADLTPPRHADRKFVRRMLAFVSGSR